MSPVAPRRGRSPDGSPLGGFGTRVPLPCPGDCKGRSPCHRVRQDPRPKPRFRLAGHAPKRWGPPGSQLPGRNPVLPDPSEAEAPSEPVAARLPEDIAFCRAGPRSEDPVSRLAGPHLARRPSGDRVGAVRSLPLSHTLKGKPVLVRYAAASSAALPSAFAGHTSEDGARHLPGLWLGRLASVAGGSSRPHREAVTLSESHQADSACG